MKITPSLSLRFSNMITALTGKLKMEVGLSDSGISRAIKPTSPDMVSSIAQWNGANRSPRIVSYLQVEDFVASNLGPDVFNRECLEQFAKMIAPTIIACAEATDRKVETVTAEFCKRLRAESVVEEV